MRGAVIAFEGIDQAGKLTQARTLAQRLMDAGTACRLLHYPDYATPIGRIIEQALTQGLALDARARTMLFAANRWEKDSLVRDHVGQGGVALIDRYSASNLVYGLSQGYDRAWLESLEQGLLPADVTVFVDISPDESTRRKQAGRDDFERNVRLLEEARRNYTLLAQEQGWLVVDGTLAPAEVAARILAGLRQRLGRQIAALAVL
jgi:dTMP kinase